MYKSEREEKTFEIKVNWIGFVCFSLSPFLCARYVCALVFICVPPKGNLRCKKVLLMEKMWKCLERSRFSIYLIYGGA
jgi:hypothetical protein